MKSVLISIQPKWCELIARGEKTVDVRKTRPKLETPFKCYIYCTKGETLLKTVHNNTLFIDNGYKDGENLYGLYEVGNGKVIGEFVCDLIGKVGWTSNPQKLDWKEWYNEETCLTSRETYEYTKGELFYEWHISDLVIYDKPRGLGGYYHYCGDNPKCDGCEAHYYSNNECGLEDFCCSIMDGCKPLKRPPQSWCYVESEG